MEIDTDIHRNSDIIFSWNMSNWASVSYCIFGDHHCNSLVAAVAPLTSWLHDSSVSSPSLFESIHSIWNIQFPDAWTLRFDNAHNWNSTLMCFRNDSWSHFRMINVKLDQMSLSSHCSLDVIVESILLIVKILGSSLELCVWMHFFKFIFLLYNILEIPTCESKQISSI